MGSKEKWPKDTNTQTPFDQLIWKAQPADLKTIGKPSMRNKSYNNFS